MSAEELVYGYAALSRVLRSAKIKSVVKADPADDKVLACAKAAKADFIASGDRHLLVLKEFESIRIVPTDKLLKQLK